MNLLNLVKDQITNEVTDKLASVVGLDNSTASSAMKHLLPGLLGGIVEKGSTERGAGDIIGAITKYGLGDNVLSGLLNHLGGGKTTDDFMGLGSNLLSGIFGGRQNNVVDILAGGAGINKSSTSSLIKLLAPIALSVLGKKIKSGNLDALGLMRMLKGERSSIWNAMPTALGAAFSGNDTATTHTRNEESTTSSSGGWWKWLLPLLLLGALAWWLLTKGDKDKKTKDSDNTEDVTTNDKDADEADVTVGTDDIDTDATRTVVIRALSVNANGHLVDANGNIIANKGSFSVDANGNIVDANGKVLVKAGSFSGNISGSSYTYLPTYSIDANGNLVDANGKIILKAGEFKEVDGYYVGTDGKPLSFVSKVGKAIGNAAESTADAFTDVFKDLFTSKEKVGSTYGLSNISWDAEKHTIRNFSKAEVEALASVLKQYPDAKMRVEVHAADADKSVSKLRANVVHDMLVTLGVNDKQISFKGMGDKNEAKAAAGAVDIVVERTMSK